MTDLPDDQTCREAHSWFVVGQAFAELRFLSRSFADVQNVRKMLTNRQRAAERSGEVDPIILAGPLAQLLAVEKELSRLAKRALKRAMPEMYEWARDTVGIGEHTVALLVGEAGHPCIAQPHHWEGEGEDRVLVADESFLRNVAKWWAYCGMGDPARRRRKGMDADAAMAAGNVRAKTLAFLLAECAMKCVGGAATTGASADLHSPSADTDPAADPTNQPSSSIDRASVGGEVDSAIVGPLPVDRPPIDGLGNDDASPVPRSTDLPRRRSPYRDVYDLARGHYAERDWTDAHRHAAALRKVAKEILKDMWIVARKTMPDVA